MNLNGYTLKGVKMMEIPSGISYTGNIYYNEQKIGSAYNDGRGGMTHVQLIPEHRDHYNVLDEEFVERLFTLNDYENVFKSNEKMLRPGRGIAFIIYANPFDLNFGVCNKEDTLDNIVALLKKENPEREIDSVEIFRSLDDFNITESRQPELYQNEQCYIEDEAAEDGMEP